MLLCRGKLNSKAGVYHAYFAQCSYSNTWKCNFSFEVKTSGIKQGDP